MRITASNNISEVDYYNGTLRVTFSNQTVYEYYNVPDQTYHGLINAPSKGQYLATFIKNHYEYRRV